MTVKKLCCASTNKSKMSELKHKGLVDSQTLHAALQFYKNVQNSTGNFAFCCKQ